MVIGAEVTGDHHAGTVCGGLLQRLWDDPPLHCRAGEMIGSHAETEIAERRLQNRRSRLTVCVVVPPDRYLLTPIPRLEETIDGALQLRIEHSVRQAILPRIEKGTGVIFCLITAT